MFDIGFLELMIIGVVGLLVLGPERLPKAARTTGLWIGKIKRTVAGMQREINAQLEAEELRQKLNEQQKKLDESLGKAKRDVESYVESGADADIRQDGSTADDSRDQRSAAPSERAPAHEGARATDLPTPPPPGEPPPDRTDATSPSEKDSRTR